MGNAFGDIVPDESDENKDNDILLRREWAMPNSWTFEINPIGDLVKREIDNSDGLWIDPFAGKAEYADITNDFNLDLDTDYTLKADEFLSQFDDGEVDGGVIFDPPYSPRQVKEMYDNVGIEVRMDDVQSTFYSRKRDAIERICSEGATVLSFGWNSVGIGKTRGFVKREILSVCHGGAHNDTICTVEDYSP